MNKYESIKADMITALKSGDKERRLTLADIVATIDKAATSGKTRVDITDTLVNEVLTKYKKTIQEMVDGCPADRAELKVQYENKLAITLEYAPTVIDDVDEIEKMINLFCASNQMVACSGNKGPLMKMIMPWLKQQNCDMRVAQTALKNAIVKGDAMGVV